MFFFLLKYRKFGTVKRIQAQLFDILKFVLTVLSD